MLYRKKEGTFEGLYCQRDPYLPFYASLFSFTLYVPQYTQPAAMLGSLKGNFGDSGLCKAFETDSLVN